jgi:hypothetical protein
LGRSSSGRQGRAREGAHVRERKKREVGEI